MPRGRLGLPIRPKTVLRAAYGLFYDQYMSIFNNRSAGGGAVCEVFAANRAGAVWQTHMALVLSWIRRPSFPGKSFSSVPLRRGRFPGKEIVAGYMQNWNLVVEHQFASDLLVRAAYVGSKGTHLLHAPEMNPAIYGPGATASNLNARRPYFKASGHCRSDESTGWSKYHSLQLTLQKRWGKGMTLLANYTYSKSIDIQSYATIEGNSAGPDPFNFNNNRGLVRFRYSAPAGRFRASLSIRESTTLIRWCEPFWADGKATSSGQHKPGHRSRFSAVSIML